MQPMDWQDLRCFHECARSGSLSGAAQALGMNATTVSRRISRLEAALDVRLFDRDGAKWTLTPFGLAALERADLISAEADKVRRAAFGEQDELKGPLRVTSGGEFMRRFLAPLVWEFGQTYPMVEIDLISSQEYLLLDRQEADIAFRATDAPPEDAIAKLLFRVDFSVYCHRDKLAALQDGTLPAFVFGPRSKRAPGWILKLPKPPSMVHTVNSDTLLMQAVEYGAAVALLPKMLGDPHDALVSVLPAHPIVGPNMWMVYHKDVRSNRRLRAFRDFCEDRLRGLAAAP